MGYVTTRPTGLELPVIRGDAALSSYSGQITSEQTYGESQVTTFNFSATNVAGSIGLHAENIAEVGSTDRETSYKIGASGYYLVGCHLGLKDITIGNANARAFVRGVVQFKKPGATGWDSIQGFPLWFYESGYTVEVLTYKYLEKDTEVKFGIQHGGSGDYQTGSGTIAASDVSRAFIMPTVVF
ncbi:hypothetical protein CGT81_07160 [Vibrio cholerae]|uniref:hypothetical protein n=1 Tax=Vibrio cholerae TaxID=666 RepID=UPI000BA9C24E|nr:hypothetical protein [Vibrio cholerae]PAR98710.1 hypothetical protein CGT81_07160 [Vibrio cholerae]